MNIRRPGKSLVKLIHPRVLRPVGTLGVTGGMLLWMSLHPATAQEQKDTPKPVSAHKVMTMAAKECQLGCKCCHTCEAPSSADKCLPGCKRFEASSVRGLEAPDVVILDELENEYLPVPFDHKGHADMAEMTKGCVVCHHYTPEGRQHPSCKDCHDPGISETSIRKPGLKGAYHRQCLGCHRDWIDQTDCAICHRRKTSMERNAVQTVPTPSTDDILGQMHPPMKQPDTEIYGAETKTGAKSVVIFRHWEHVQGFDLACVECHHEENCSRCHVVQTPEEETSPPTVREHHEPCIQCHEADMRDPTDVIEGRCKRCHWKEGDPTIKPFDHADTGWPLSRYHEANSCRACHRSVPFVKLSTECDACHSAWGPGTFDHSITGQYLDDNHKDAHCEDCHADRKFDAPPACDQCHEEDENIAFPASRPGPIFGQQPPSEQ